MREDVVELPDGRRLGFSELGTGGQWSSSTSRGAPGLDELPMLDEADVAASGLRVLTLERPGSGLSTRLPGRMILDWPMRRRGLRRHAGHRSVHRPRHLGGRALRLGVRRRR